MFPGVRIKILLCTLHITLFSFRVFGSRLRVSLRLKSRARFTTFYKRVVLFDNIVIRFLYRAHAVNGMIKNIYESSGVIGHSRRVTTI